MHDRNCDPIHVSNVSHDRVHVLPRIRADDDSTVYSSGPFPLLLRCFLDCKRIVLGFYVSYTPITKRVDMKRKMGSHQNRS